MASHPQPWPGTTISLGKHLKLSKVQSDVMKSDMFFENLRTQRDTLPSIANAGWHFSYCLPMRIPRKANPADTIAYNPVVIHFY